MPTTVFVLVISTQSLVKHQIVINPVRLTKYHTITIVIFVTYDINTNLLSRSIQLSLLSPSANTKAKVIFLPKVYLVTCMFDRAIESVTLAKLLQIVPFYDMHA